MMKRMFRVFAWMLVLLQLAAILSCFAAFAEGEASGLPSVTVLRTDAGAMTVDGKATVGEAWDKTEWSTQAFKQIGSEKVPAGSGIRFKTLWGTQDGKSYLFFLIDVNDDTLDATGRAWNQDNVRVFLDEDGIGEDNAKPVRNDANYGSIYASSEFMSYAPNTYASKGFEYGATKKEDGSGYFVEVRYTYQNAALAVPDAAVRANLTVVFANTEGNPAQFLWSWDSAKWSAGLNDKEYFGHAGTLKLSGTEVVSEEEKPKPPVTPSMSTEARQTTVDAVKIDGKADEKDVWDQVEWSDPAVAYKKQPIATEGSDAYQESYGKFGFRFKTLWATDGKKAYVYFLIDVSDSNLTSTKRAWASDNVRIFLDETGTAAEGTLAKLNRESAYASSEFMSYATVENSLGYKYRSKKKEDGTGYVVEVQYTLSNPELASVGAKMKLNVVANDADSTNDDGTHYAQQFAWSWLSDLAGAYPQIDCIEHAGLLTLSGETVKPEERETGSESGENTEPPTTRPDEQPGAETAGPSGAVTTDAGTAPAASGCASAVGMTGFGLLMLSAAALPVLFRRKKKD